MRRNAIADTRAGCTVLIALLLILGSPEGRAQQTAPSILGRVVAAENGAALARARIAIVVDLKRGQSVFTDDRGRFTLPAPDGEFVTLVVTKAGFATAQRVVRRADVRDDELRFALNRSASITGRVVDKSGEAVVDAPVTALAADSGARVAASPERFESLTDDRGEFRIGGLPAGHYRVTATAAGVDASPATIDVRAGDEAGPVELVTATTGTSQPIPAAGPSDSRGAFIRGRVLNAAKRPIAGASLRVVLIGDVVHTAMSDERGRYVIDELSAGSYSVEASKTGYVTVQYGQTRGAQPGLQVTVRAEETLNDIDVVLPRGSAVTGTITDERGEPLEGVTVRALQLVHGNGRTSALRVPGVKERQTDDRGRYRLFGMLPGSYLIVASVEATISGADDRMYAPIFHPGTTQVTSAVPVEADIGRDVSAIDLVFHQVPSSRVSGTVRDGSGAPVAGSVLLVASQRSGAVVLEPRQGIRTNGDGSFTIANVPPGDYVVQAAKPRGGGSAPEFGREFVTVGEGDPKPISVRTSSGSTLEGRYVIEGRRDRDVVVRVLPIPADFDYGPLVGQAPTRQEANSNDTFSMSGLFGPTRFRISGTDDWYVKSITIGGVDVTDVPFDFGSTSQTITGAEVVVSNAGGSIMGHVTDARSMPVSNYSIVVFSTDRTKWFSNSRSLKFGRPSQDGGFEVIGLPPGEYWVVAVDTIQGNQSFGEWEKPDVLETLSTRATRVTLAERERYITVLRLIRR